MGRFWAAGIAVWRIDCAVAMLEEASVALQVAQEAEDHEARLREFQLARMYANEAP